MLTPDIIVPTLNAAKEWKRFAPALLACIHPKRVLIVDSQSTDGTVELALAAGFRVHSIPRERFNHGTTRQLAAHMLPESEILVYLTQDAVLADSAAISRLVSAFDDPTIAAAYGRQLPRSGAGAIESHARRFNYSPASHIRDLRSRDELGIKSIFISNSFAAYRREALMKVGGFPQDVIFGEDTVTAARLLLSGDRIAYVAEAIVYHSHPYTCTQEFKRYFDIGVLHRREHWLLEKFGNTKSEGRKFVLSELFYLRQAEPFQIPSALLRTGLKLLGYRMGGMERILPLALKTRLSMHKRFWLTSAS
jgi:rhamnosyltransferase